MNDRSSTIAAIRRGAIPLQSDRCFPELLERASKASLVLLGEATHGSREFYRTRAEISKRLITDFGFDAVAVEADWPDALQVSKYAQDGPLPAGADSQHAAQHALRGFQRFPQWMWRNTEIVEFILWLREHNMRQPDGRRRAGFYGLDVYSLRASMDAVIHYLDRADPAAAQRARARYGCFDHLAEDPQRYGYAATFGIRPDCEQEVVRQLVELSSETARSTLGKTSGDGDELFYAQQNARVARNAEAYYRSMFLGRDASWNLRDTHMADTLDALRDFLAQRNGRPPRIAVWAHNSHLGDARATEMGDHGQINLGELVRERHPGDSFLLGFTTHEGTVTAASDWDAPAERKTIRPSHADSYERLFHDCAMPGFMLPLERDSEASALLHERRLERAIGVLYLPESERLSHYFHADLASQFDAVIHFDHTHALHPLDKSPRWTYEEIPETYPSGM